MKKLFIIVLFPAMVFSACKAGGPFIANFIVTITPQPEYAASGIEKARLKKCVRALATDLFCRNCRPLRGLRCNPAIDEKFESIMKSITFERTTFNHTSR